MAKNQDFGKHIRSFGATLYGYIIASQEGNQINSLISPFSLYTALSMTLAGSKGQTEEELLRALNLPATVNHKAIGDYLRNCCGHPGHVELDSANRLFLLCDLQIMDCYQFSLKENYDAECESLAHLPDNEAKRKSINEFVSKATRHKIEELIPTGAIEDYSRLMLINALYFKGLWDTPFPAEETKPRTFYKHDNSTIEIPMMSDTRWLCYAKLNEIKAEAIKLPFKGNKNWEMLIVLPLADDGLPAVQNYLKEPGNLEHLLSHNFVADQITVILPKFRLSKHPMINMTEILKKMGVSRLFNSLNADLSRICEERQLHVSGFCHQAVLEVDEQGATAAAVTAMDFSDSINTTFRVDHPFCVLIIRDDKVPIFMGHVWEPECF